MNAPASNTEVLAVRVQMMEQAILELRASNKSIAESLQKIARLEERHAETREALNRAFRAIETQSVELRGALQRQGEDLDKRLAAVEQQMPKLNLVAGWVVALLLTCAAAAGGLVWSRVAAPALPPPKLTAAPLAAVERQ